MGCFDCGKAVVNSMCSGKTAGFKTNTGKIGVCFDNVFNSFGADFVLNCKICRYTVFEKGFVAKFCKSKSGFGGFSANAVACLALCAGSCFKISCKSITDACSKKSCGSFGNNVGINKNDVGVAGEEKVFFKNAFVGIDYGKRRTGSVGGSNGGNDYNGFSGVVTNCFCGVVGFSAADTDNNVAAFFL